MSEDLVIEILREIQNELAGVKHRIEQVGSSMDFQFTALNEKLSDRSNGIVPGNDVSG